MSRFERWLWLAPPVVSSVDLILRRRPLLPLAVKGPLDETAHAATALLLLRALQPQADTTALLATTAGAVLLDADHIPQFLGWYGITRDPDERPYPHALVTVAALLGVAALLPARPRGLLSAAAFGAATHLVRDAATGGAPLLWPLSRRSVRIPYGVYAAALSVAATRARRTLISQPAYRKSDG